jgi:hypothetical protein
MTKSEFDVGKAEESAEGRRVGVRGVFYSLHVFSFTNHQSLIINPV